MPNLDELAEQLVKLPRREYSTLIREVDTKRRREVERAGRGKEPDGGMSRDEFAFWIGRQHFDIDKGICRIIYLPSGAPPKEVRLLEVNDLAPIPENAPVMAFDFRPVIDGIDYSLFVADVTPAQFEAIEKYQLALPEGWLFEGHQEIPLED